jgi:xanthine dehydrogenase molybdenum-binding subunit
MGVGTHVSNAWPFCVDYDNAYLTMQQDGTVQLAIGVPEIGCGSATTLAQLAGETLGLPPQSIRVVQGDTAATPFDIGSHASRTLYAGGTAVIAAAEQLKQKILQFAATACATPADALEIAEGQIIATATGAPLSSLAALAYQAHLQNRQFVGIGQTIPGNAPPWHAHFAEVEADLSTGKISVLKVVAAHDVGKAINPLIVEGQIEGGVLMSVGYATGEEIVYDEQGKQQNTSYHSYMLPTAADRPEIEALIIEAGDPTGPLGAKGVGETGTIPTPAAILNAVYDALGIRFTELPLNEERVFKAWRDKQEQKI